MNCRPSCCLFIAVSLCSAFFATPASAQTIVYVDEHATGPMYDGSEWCTAFTDLQNALEGAASWTTIRVADGTYTPDWETGDRWATFRLVNGVRLEGGYVGCGAPDPDERDIELHETILSGDLNDDDGPDFENYGDNSYHVVTGNSTDASAVLDGFTVTGGNADSSDYLHDCGGGIYNDNSSPTLINCTFSGNIADGYYGHGGGMYNQRFSHPTLTNCTFTGNIAHGYGGGIYNFTSNPTLTNCTVVENTAGNGGGMVNFGGSPIVTNCIFSGNSAYGPGGGMYSHLGNPMLTNCTFTGNTAHGYGGGMYSSGGSPILTNCIFWDDTPDEIDSYSGSVTYSDIEGGYSGIGNRMFDPLFVNPDAGDYRLSEGSRCINAGDPDFAPGTTDLDGHARVLCGRVDMGAYEFGIGDHDCDQAVDLFDFAQWQTCMTGPGGGPYAEGCEAFDFEYDGDVDLVDYAAVQARWDAP